jgi:hypothetical protein
VTDASRHGLFRRLRRATSWAPPGPGPSGSPASATLRSRWLRSAFGLEANEASRSPAAATEADGTPGSAEGWPDPEHIVEPVWVLEPDPLD